MEPPAEPRMLSADEFWDALRKYGMETTDSYTADGRSRFCKRKDGQICVVSVHDSYPEYIVDRVLIDNGFMDIPLYDNLN
jgi:hypothetical protein